jgi:8-oxo-dGTP diphosphatase
MPSIGSIISRLEQEALRDRIEARVVGGVVCRNGLTLILIRSKDHPFLPGCGDIAGGYALPDESLLDALQRETREETGLDVTRVIRFLGTFDYRSARGLLARQFNFEIELSGSKILLMPEEHSEYTWCDPKNTDELTRLRVSPELREILSNV